MQSIVYTLTETNGRTGFVLAVFADRALAIEAAQSHARRRIEYCLAADARLPGNGSPDGVYVPAIVAMKENAELFIVHRPSGERDAVAWQILPFDVIERPTEPDPVQACLFHIAP